MKDLYVGIDVSKDTLETARSDRPNTTTCTPNTLKEIPNLVSQMVQLKPKCIVVESTGGLERPLVDALLDAGLPVALVNPSKVRFLAKGLGIEPKTDPIDAHLLARFAELAAPRLLEKYSRIQRELDGLIDCRRQLIKTRVEQTNRLSTTTQKAAVKALQNVIKALDKQIAELDRQIDEHIDSNDQWKQLYDKLTDVPGVGRVLGVTLLAKLPELGSLDSRRISRLAGVAPINNDSGIHKGKRSIKGGRACVRNTLYMAALAAMRSNPIIKPFAQRLQKAGKPAKVVIVACMRKLLTLLNVMARENITWHQLDLVKNT